LQHYKRDTRSIKYLVLAVWTLDTAQQVASTHSMFSYIVTTYGNVADVILVNPSALASFIVAGLCATLVQLFFIFRAWQLSGRKCVIAAVLLPCCLSAFGMLLAFIIQM